MRQHLYLFWYPVQTTTAYEKETSISAVPFITLGMYR